MKNKRLSVAEESHIVNLEESFVEVDANVIPEFKRMCDVDVPERQLKNLLHKYSPNIDAEIYIDTSKFGYTISIGDKNTNYWESYIYKPGEKLSDDTLNLIDKYLKQIALKNANESNYHSHHIEGKPLNEIKESLHQIGNDMSITDSPYTIRDILLNKPKAYRILYDSNIDSYMFCDASENIHYDLIRAARKQGYYNNMEDFIDELGALDNYIDYGKGGQFLENEDGEEEEVDAYLLYMIYIPKDIDEDDVDNSPSSDGYDARLNFDFGTLFLRDADEHLMDNCELISLLQKTTRRNNVDVREHLTKLRINEEATSNVGYRNPEIYGSGITDIDEVVSFEICELENLDIPYTMLDNWNLKPDDKKLLENRIDSATDSDDSLEALSQTTLNLIHKYFPNVTDALWLASKSAVFDRYEGNSDNIEEYDIEIDVPLSDLGFDEDGVLFMYSHRPRPKKSLDETSDKLFVNDYINEAGYFGYSMSNNAKAAYEDGEKPLSKWNKSEVVAYIASDLGISPTDIKLKHPYEHYLVKSSWHHTSSKYNKTDFYSVVYDVTEIELSDKAKAQISDDKIRQNIEELSRLKNKLDKLQQYEPTISHEDDDLIYIETPLGTKRYYKSMVKPEIALQKVKSSINDEIKRIEDEIKSIEFEIGNTNLPIDGYVNESYIEVDGEQFFDYHTGDVQGKDIFDTSKTGMSFYDEFLTNQKYMNTQKNLKSEIKQLTPTEYFQGCADIFHSTVESQINQTKADQKTINHLKNVITKLGKKFPLTYLNFAKNQQEGRHRMYVAGELFGWNTKFPVMVITPYDEEKFKQDKIAEIEQENQRLLNKINDELLKFRYRNDDDFEAEIPYVIEHILGDNTKFSVETTPTNFKIMTEKGLLTVNKSDIDYKTPEEIKAEEEEFNISDEELSNYIDLDDLDFTL